MRRGRDNNTPPDANYPRALLDRPMGGSTLSESQSSWDGLGTGVARGIGRADGASRGARGSRCRHLVLGYSVEEGTPTLPLAARVNPGVRLGCSAASANLILQREARVRRRRLSLSLHSPLLPRA